MRLLAVFTLFLAINMPKRGTAEAKSLKPMPKISISKSSKGTTTAAVASTSNVNAVDAYPVSTSLLSPDSLKLLFGAGGIYAAFLYYGSLQEDVFHYKSVDGEKFKYVWFLQALGNICFFTK